METQQNEQAWLKYYQSGALGKKPTNREVFLARKAFLAGRESAQHSVQSDGAGTLPKSGEYFVEYVESSVVRLTPRR